MKNIFFILVLGSLVFSSHFADAAVEVEEVFNRPWSGQLHIFAGAGFNLSSFRSSAESRDLGVGLNFKTDVGWYFNDQWAMETSASVKFNRVDNDLIWDTLMTVGVRYHFRNFLGQPYGYYSRAFIGSAPTVVFLDESDALAKSDEISRIHFEGPVVGLGFGKMYLDRKNGPILFIEGNASYQKIQHRDDIRMDGETPITVSSYPVEDSNIYSIYLVVGMLLF